MRTSTLIFIISIGMIIALFVLLGAMGNVDLIKAVKSESVVGLWYVLGYGLGSLFLGLTLVSLLKYVAEYRGKNDEI